MAKKKISELPAGGALNGTELVPIVQTGTTKRITAQDIANLGNASGVEGSGTINRLAKFTATSTIGNSQLFDDGTSVGLGTITPLGLLHLFKASAATRMVIDGNAGQNKIITYRTNAVQRFGLYVNNTAESGSNVGSDFAIRAYNDAGTLLSTPLFIKRSTGAVTFSGSVTAGDSLLINNLSVSKKGYKFQSPSSNWSPQQSGIFFTPADGTNAATTFSVELWDGNGNTTNALSIAPLGAATFSSSVTAQGANIGINALGTDRMFQISGNTFTTGATQFAAVINPTMGAVTNLYGIYAGLTCTSATNYYALYLETATGTITNRFGIYQSGSGEKNYFAGSVGIGTTNPNLAGASKGLSINSSGYTTLELNQNDTRAFFVYSDAGQSILGTFGAAPLIFRTNDTDRMRILSNGNVLIGTSTDSGNKFSVNGNALVTGKLTNEQTAATQITSEIGNTNVQGVSQLHKIVRHYGVVTTGNKLIIPFISQGDLQITTFVRIIGHSAKFNDINPLAFSAEFAVGSLNLLQNLAVLQSSGNILTILINGMNIEITFVNSYTSGTANGIYTTIEYMASQINRSIDVPNITMN